MYLHRVESHDCGSNYLKFTLLFIFHFRPNTNILELTTKMSETNYFQSKKNTV